jgi:hypothetical protein
MLDAGPTQPYWRHFFMGLHGAGGAGILLTPRHLATAYREYRHSIAMGGLRHADHLRHSHGVSRSDHFRQNICASQRNGWLPVLLFVMFVIGMLGLAILVDLRRDRHPLSRLDSDVWRLVLAAAPTV